MLLKLSEKVSLSTEDYVNIFSVPNFVSPDYAGLACVAGVWKRRERGLGREGNARGARGGNHCFRHPAY